jgi:hypothetical protein
LQNAFQSCNSGLELHFDDRDHEALDSARDQAPRVPPARRRSPTSWRAIAADEAAELSATSSSRCAAAARARRRGPRAIEALAYLSRVVADDKRASRRDDNEHETAEQPVVSISRSWSKKPPPAPAMMSTVSSISFVFRPSRNMWSTARTSAPPSAIPT